MQIIEGTTLSKMVDYSFGDHLGGLDPTNLIGGHMKFASEFNREFIDRCKQFEGRIMTLFIDNIRLYNRPLEVNAGPDEQWVQFLLENNDLLATCATLPRNKFIIFTSHEDTPIDAYIRLPDNVLGIHAVNALYNTERIHPFPIGLQRQIGINDNRLEIMKQFVDRDRDEEPTKLVYINCGLGQERNYAERASLPEFEQYDWATCRFQAQSKFYPYERYTDFLTELRDHKFMICPKGHGADCHRNWESLYLRRVPIMRDDPYFRLLMKGFPVLFVKEWSDITPQLLKDNEHLYTEAQKMSLKKLDLNLIFDTIIQSYEHKDMSTV